MLKPSEVLVDHHVQQAFRPKHAADIASEYQPALFGVGSVSARADGYYVMDSQHRCAAAIIAGMGDIPVPFKVWRDLTLEQEAQMFLDLNGKKKNPSAVETFRISFAAGNPATVDIVSILEGFGLTFGFRHSNGSVSAVKALVQIHSGCVRGVSGLPRFPHPGRVLLIRTLRNLVGSWGRDRNAFDGLMLRSMAAFIVKYGDGFDEKKLQRKLGKNSDPVRATGQIKSIKNFAKTTDVAAGVEFLKSIYNHGVTEASKLK